MSSAINQKRIVQSENEHAKYSCVNQIMEYSIESERPTTLQYKMKVLATSFAHFLLLLVGSSLLDSSLGWSFPSGNRHNEATKTATDHASFAEQSAIIDQRGSTTRREAVQRTLTTLIGGTVASTALLSSTATLSSSTRFGFVESAHADVTNKVASSTALRALARTQEKLPTKLLPDVQANDFIGVKARLREPPFDTVRKNAQILVRGGEDGPRTKELVRSYKDLIGALEKIDSTASLGMRGRSIGPLEMSEQYEVLIAALASFLKVGSEAADIPLQEQPSMQENLRTGSIETKVLTSD